MTMKSDEVDEKERPWDDHVRKALNNITKEARFNKEEVTITLNIGRDDKLNPMLVKFVNYDELRTVLGGIVEEIIESRWENSGPFEDAESEFEPYIEVFVDYALTKLNAAEFFERIPAYRHTKKLFTSGNLLSPKATLTLTVDLSDINAELIKYLANHPDKMRDLHPKRFEELVAELFKAKGYEVKVTRFSKDGGFDIRAVRRTDVGLGLTLIECKRYAANRPVGVHFINALYGVVEKYEATGGLCVTTSYFTHGAKALKEELRYRIDLADFERLKVMLHEYGKG
jgi:restriction endonuclease Mrr